MMSRILVTIPTLLVLFLSCSKDKQENLPDFPGGCDNQVGSFTLLETSLHALPYDSSTVVVFSDSLANEIELKTVKIDVNHHAPVTYVLDDHSTPPHETRYCYYQDIRHITLRNDSLKLELSIYLSTILDSNQPSEGNVSDWLRIDVTQEGTLPIGVTMGTFFKTLDKRTSTYDIQPEHLDSLDCFGKVFYNVEFISFAEPLHFDRVYFMPLNGVVSFKDFDHKRWRFERFK